MTLFLQILHFSSCFALIAVVMLQAGKGSQIGATFAAGASQTLFGTVGQKDIMVRITAGICTVFFVTSILLARRAEVSFPESKVAAEAARQEAQSVPPNNP